MKRSSWRCACHVCSISPRPSYLALTANGDVFEGRFKNDQMEGEGTYKFAMETIPGARFPGGNAPVEKMYVGQWHDDQMEGHGTNFYAVRIPEAACAVTA